RFIAVEYPSLGRSVSVDQVVRPDHAVVREDRRTLPATTPLSQPYWLRRPGSPGMSDVEDPTLIGRPEDPPAFPVEYIFDIEGDRMVLSGEPVPATPSSPSDVPARLMIVPPVSLQFASDVDLFAPGASRAVTVELVAARRGIVGRVALDAPAGWRVTPAS